MIKIIFVDDESGILESLKLTLRPMRHEWDMSFVTNGVKALEMMSNESYDVLVTDMRMPVMDGVELLNEVRKHHPRTIRIALSDKACKDAMLNSIGPMHRYLIKPCSIETLKTTIDQTYRLHELLHSENLVKAVSQIESLPSLPDLYYRIIDEVKSPSSSMRKVGDIIARDMSMTAKILHLVNSAMFGLSREITSPAEAVNLLGLETIKILVLSVHVFSTMRVDKCKKMMMQLWQHSVNVGLIARNISQSENLHQVIVDYSYLGGILHDVGKIVLIDNYCEQYKDAVARSLAEKVPICSVEKELFGVTHAEIGGYLIQLWGLPDPVVESIIFHHTPERYTPKKPDSVAIIHASDHYDYLLHPDHAIGFQSDRDTELFEGLGMSKHQDSWKKTAAQTQFENMII